MLDPDISTDSALRHLHRAEDDVWAVDRRRFLQLVGMGLGAGLVAEVADSSIHTTNELQESLGIPVLVSVPRIMLESDRAARSRRILRETLAAIAVVLFVLIGGGVTYYFVNMAGKAGMEEAEIEGTTEEARGGDLGELAALGGILWRWQRGAELEEIDCAARLGCELHVVVSHGLFYCLTVPLGIALTGQRAQDRRVFGNVGGAHPGRRAAFAAELPCLLIDAGDELLRRFGRRGVDGR